MIKNQEQQDDYTNYDQRHDEITIISLVLLERLSTDKIQSQLLLQEKCDELCLNILQTYIDNNTKISVEAAKMACNLISTFAIVSP